MRKKCINKLMAISVGTALALSVVFGNGQISATAAEVGEPTVEEAVVESTDTDSSGSDEITTNEGATEVVEGSGDETTQTDENTASAEEGSGEEVNSEEPAASEEGTTEEATTEEGTAQEGTTEEGTQTEGTTEEGNSEEKAAEEAATEEQATEESASEEKAPEEAAAEEGTTEEVPAEEAATEEQTGEEATAEEPTAEEVPAEEAATEIAYPVYDSEITAGDYKLSLKAPEGVLPEGTEVKAELVSEIAGEAIEGLLEGQLAENEELIKVVSFDITFSFNGEEIEPKDGKVSVSIKVPEEFTEKLEADEDSFDPEGLNSDATESEEKVLKVFHFADDKAISLVSSTVEEDVVAYEADSFSIYSLAIIGIPQALAVTFTNGSYTLTTTSGDLTAELRDALDVAKKNPNNGPYTIKIKAGNYTMTNNIEVPSNVTIDAEGATIVAAGEFGNFMIGANNTVHGTAVGGYDGLKNVTIKGGTWDAAGKLTGVLFRFAHMTNLTLDGVTIKSPGKNHHIEIGAVKGCVIKNCQFLDNAAYNGEAIELDCMTDESAFPAFGPFDKYCCEDVEIYGCTIDSVGRALGSHRTATGFFYNNINVHDNTLTNIGNIAIEAKGWTNSSITNNTMSGSGMTTGIECPIRVEGAKLDEVYKGTGGASSFTANLTISNNTIDISSSGTTNGIRIGGFVLEGTPNDGLAKGEYKVNGFTVDGNTINGKCTRAINVSLTDNSTIKNNVINGQAGSKTPLILSKACGCTIDGNTIRNSLESGAKGIYSSNSSGGNTITNNKIFNVSKDSSFGILIEGVAENCVDGNIIYNCGKIGIGITGKATVNSVSNNVVSVCAVDGILVDKSSKVTAMEGNNISDIKRYGVLAHSKSTVKKCNNNYINSKKAPLFADAKSKIAGFGCNVTLGVGEKVDCKAYGTSGCSSSNSKSKVASLSSGKLTGKAKGTTKLVSKVKGAKGVTKVSVGSKPKEVTVAEANVTLKSGDASLIVPSVNSGAGCGTYKFSSSNKGVVKVSKTGVIQAVGAGSATVTVKTYNGKKTTVNVTVQ